MQQPAQNADRGGLARAVGSQEPEYLALARREGDAIDRGEGAEALDQVLNRDRHVIVHHFATLEKEPARRPALRWEPAREAGATAIHATSRAGPLASPLTAATNRSSIVGVIWTTSR